MRETAQPRSTLAEVATPALLLDRDVASRNMARMRAKIAAADPATRLRPHMKSAKSVAVADLLFDGGKGPIAVSTLREAERFGAAGFADILYAVGISPDKIERALALRRAGIDLKLLTDDLGTARAIAARAAEAGVALPTFVEIDVDGHRAGLRWNDAAGLASVATALAPACLAGVLTHAGASYRASDPVALDLAAAEEAARARHAASLIRAASDAPLVVSIGSTPTALAARDLTGVDEVRAGVYMFFDLVMAGVGVCGLDDIALSVLATVTGVYPERGRAIVDAGWMAMSRDRGTASQAVDQRYGVVRAIDGGPLGDLILAEANQEHGVITPRSGGGLEGLRVGDRVRILPNHACATAAQHARYVVVAGKSADVIDIWERFNGW